MRELKCKNCGAPLKVRPRDIRRDAVSCEFCGVTTLISEQIQPMDEEVQQGLRMLGRIQGLLGIDIEDPEKPAEKPADTKITLENEPGARFAAKIPGAGFRVRNIFMIMFTGFWCSFMVVWNVIALSQQEWTMFAFGFFHDLVGIGLALSTLWGIFGSEVLEADGDYFTRTRKLFLFKRSKKFPLNKIEDVVFKIASRTNNQVRRGLYLMVGSKKVRIASNADMTELRWLRTQLQKYFKPLWE